MTQWNWTWPLLYIAHKETLEIAANYFTWCSSNLPFCRLGPHSPRLCPSLSSVRTCSGFSPLRQLAGPLPFVPWAHGSCLPHAFPELLHVSKLPLRMQTGALYSSEDQSLNTDYQLFKKKKYSLVRTHWPEVTQSRMSDMYRAEFLQRKKRKSCAVVPNLWMYSF